MSVYTVIVGGQLAAIGLIRFKQWGGHSYRVPALKIAATEVSY